ncbi:hypothetical protein Plec18167_005409 [Paecilomyces lecythidis]|uniref:Major facilitator superfamily (MFS) profile domain-containing protein n=1 Tax=Paecilomyces lecythidis TaxID=3004212 RepID=A0ABR3XK78_9EURO
MLYLGLTGKGLLAGITVSSGMAFILFGYDDGVMGSILTAPNFINTFKLDSSMQGTVTAIFILGCFAGSLTTSAIGQRYGRIRMAHAGTVAMCVGAILQCSSYSVAQLLVGRIVAGIGLGLITSNTIVWQSETAPPKIRGMLVACSLSFLVLGQVIAYWLEYGTSTYTSSFSWRFPMAFQAFIALVTSAMLCFMPESPRWLLTKDRGEEALDILQKLEPHADPSAIAAEAAEIRQASELEREAQKGWRDLFKKDRINSRRRVATACLVNLMQDLSGSTPISYYTTYIFENSIGMSRHLALLMSGFLQVWFLIASFGTWFLIERAGRRRSFMLSATGMSIVMFILAAMLAVDTHASGIVAAIMIFAYQAFYTWGFMGGVWTYGPEILPLEYRSKGTGLATATLWLFCFVIIEVVPVGITNIHWKLFLIFGIFNLSYLPLVYFFFPETAGFTLEMVDLCFMSEDMSPVAKARELQQAMKRGENVNLSLEVGAKEKEENAAHIEVVGSNTG